MHDGRTHHYVHPVPVVFVLSRPPASLVCRSPAHNRADKRRKQRCSEWNSSGGRETHKKETRTQSSLPSVVARRRGGPPPPPVRAIHGTEDRVLSVQRARRSVRRLRRRGWDAELSEHDGGGHTVTAAMGRQLHETLAELLAVQ